MVSELWGGDGFGDTSGGTQGLLPAQCLRVAPCGTQGIRQYWGLSPGLLHAKPGCSLFRTLGYDLEMALEGIELRWHSGRNKPFQEREMGAQEEEGAARKQGPRKQREWV